MNPRAWGHPDYCQFCDEPWWDCVCFEPDRTDCGDDECPFCRYSGERPPAERDLGGEA